MQYWTEVEHILLRQEKQQIRNNANTRSDQFSLCYYVIAERNVKQKLIMLNNLFWIVLELENIDYS